MEKVNVLFVIPQVERGGTENLVLSLINGLNHNIFKSYLVYFHFFGNFQFLNEFVEAGASVYQIPREKRLDFSTMLNIASIVKENNIHIVNAHHFVSFFYSYFGCKIGNQVKLIFTNHSCWEIENITWKSRLAGRLTLRNIDKVVGVTDEVTKRFIDTYHINSSKTCTILNGVDLDKFSLVAIRAKIRHELEVGDKTIIIGVIANFRKVKNHIFLVKAIEKLIRLNKDVKVVFVGQSFKNDPESSIEEVHNFIKSSGLGNKIILMGYRTDTPELLSSFDIFCLTSLKEGLPISVIEAMAAGLPVVGTNVDGINEVVIPGKTGLLVNLGDVDGLATALYTLIENTDLRHKMGQAARQRAEKKYSLERCISEYEALFLSILQSSENQRAKTLPY